jgi:hypothetical protein
MRAIRTCQRNRDGCPNDSCAYIQMHGKGPSDTTFISPGLAVCKPFLQDLHGVYINFQHPQLTLTFSSVSVHSCIISMRTVLSGV